MKVKTTVKAGGINLQHNEKLVRSSGLKVHSGVQAGGKGINLQHNEALVRRRG